MYGGISEEAFKIVCEFDRLPLTPEKKEICQKYLKDEITRFELVSLARKYLEKQTKPEEESLEFKHVYEVGDGNE